MPELGAFWLGVCVDNTFLRLAQLLQKKRTVNLRHPRINFADWKIKGKEMTKIKSKLVENSVNNVSKHYFIICFIVIT